MEFIEILNSEKGHRMGLFLCPYCGNKVKCRISSINSGHQKRCIECKYKYISSKKIKHNLSRTKIYKVWAAMINRCYNIQSQNYSLYGNRGISVCDEWKNDFKSFYDWAMKNGYDNCLTIDRINNDGNYEPSNCRFISSSENSRNRRQSKLSIEKVSLIKEMINKNIKNVEIAKAFNVNPSLISKIKWRKVWDI